MGSGCGTNMVLSLKAGLPLKRTSSIWIWERVSADPSVRFALVVWLRALKMYSYQNQYPKLLRMTAQNHCVVKPNKETILQRRTLKLPKESHDSPKQFYVAQLEFDSREMSWIPSPAPHFWHPRTLGTKSCCSRSFSSFNKFRRVWINASVERRGVQLCSPWKQIGHFLPSRAAPAHSGAEAHRNCGYTKQRHWFDRFPSSPAPSRYRTFLNET